MMIKALHLAVIVASVSGHALALPPIRVDQLPPLLLDAGVEDKDGVCVAVNSMKAKPGQRSLGMNICLVDRSPWNLRSWDNFGINFYINRVVTDDLDDNGFLAHPSDLVAKGIIAPTVTVEFPILFFPFNMATGEIISSLSGIDDHFDVVSINGKKYWQEDPTGPLKYPWQHNFIKTLSYNKPIKLEIPVELVKFPKKASVGMTPDLAINTFVITGWSLGGWSGMDWAMTVPWVKTSVKAMAPIFLVHGTNADHTTWEVPKGDSFSEYFLAYPQNFYGISFSDIDLKPNGSVDTNGKILEEQIADRLASVGAKQCHIVAHSKGGNDSRSMIYSHYKDKLHRNESLELPRHFEVLSLYTLETPHRGTVLADISWNSLNAGDQAVRADPNWGDLQTLISWDFSFAHHTPSDDPDGMSYLTFSNIVGAPAGHALRDNMTRSMQNINDEIVIDYSHANMGRPIKFYNTAADADWHIRNLEIDDQENYIGLKDSFGILKDTQYPLNFLASSAYRMLSGAKEVRGDRQTPIPPYNVAMWKELYVYNQNNQGTWNDLVVAISSSKFDGGTLFCPTSLSNDNNILLGNHSSIKTHSMAAAIVSQIRTDWITW